VTTQESDDRLARLEAELAATREDVARLREDNLGLARRVRTQEHGAGRGTARKRVRPIDGETVTRPRMSRGDFLRLGGAAAAGAVAVTASGLLSATPANASTTGDAITIGEGNPVDLDGQGNTTQLFWNPDSPGRVATNLLEVTNFQGDQNDLTGYARVALSGQTAGNDTTSLPQVGVFGGANSYVGNSIGVVGIAGEVSYDEGAPTPFVDDPTGGTGVFGTAPAGGNGVVGASDGDPSCFGVYGASDEGFGVIGDSTTGISLRAAGGGRLLQTLRSIAGAPTTGSFDAGEQIRDLAGALWLCVAFGTPGTWVRAATVANGVNGGSVNFLAHPIRLFDSRSSSGALAAGATHNVQVTGVTVGGVSIPAGAVGVMGTVTVTGTSGPSGYLTMYPQGSPPPAASATSNINWFAAGQTLATAAIVALNAANGQLTISNGISGGSAPTQVIFDAAAYVI
jgi:hypothetical protein